MAAIDYEGIVEVREVAHSRLATFYLTNGYKLLHIGSLDLQRDINHDGKNWNVRRLGYVLGRTRDVAPAGDPPDTRGY